MVTATVTAMVMAMAMEKESKSLQKNALVSGRFLHTMLFYMD